MSEGCPLCGTGIALRVGEPGEEPAEGDMVFWCVYERPRDYPESWVVRRQWAASKGVIVAELSPRAVASTYESVVACIPPGLVCLPRSEGDVASLVESWI